MQSGIETLREGVKQSILSQRLHNSEPQRDASVLLSRPAILPEAVQEPASATATKGRDANAALDAFTKPVQQPAGSVVVGTTSGAILTDRYDSSTIPVL